MRLGLVAFLLLVLSACAAYTPDNFRLISDTSALVSDGMGHGSGTVIGPHRLLTAAHVAEHDGLSVILADGSEHKAKLIWKSKTTDAAIMSFEGAPARHYAKLDCAPVEVGEPLAWVGNPLELRRVYNSGFVSGEQTGSFFEGQPMVPVSALFNPGDSGSGLFSPGGRVRGVVSAFAVTRIGFGGSQSGIGLMTPASAFCAEAGLK